jgi:purine-binding chemotaxis protein CheW
MDDVTAKPSQASVPQEAPQQYLTFSLGDAEYAVDVLRVREIRGMGPIAPIPNEPEHVRGVMNLRGAVVPVIDLRVALGLAPASYGKFTVIIVLFVKNRTMGFVVDTVCDVVNLLPAEVERAPELGPDIDPLLVDGVARVDGRFVVLLDIDKIAHDGLAAGAG